MQSDKPLVLVVSSGPVQVAVPNVVGQPQATATANLQHDGFVVTTTTATNNTVPTGRRHQHQPSGRHQAAQRLAGPAGGVDREAEGRPSRPWSDRPPSAAGQSLGQLGLIVGDQVSEPSSSVQFGRVTRTDPPAGLELPIGSSVTVYVSSGRAPGDRPRPQQRHPGERQRRPPDRWPDRQLQPAADHQPEPEWQGHQPDPRTERHRNKGSTVNVVVGSTRRRPPRRRPPPLRRRPRPPGRRPPPRRLGPGRRPSSGRRGVRRPARDHEREPRAGRNGPASSPAAGARRGSALTRDETGRPRPEGCGGARP